MHESMDKDNITGFKSPKNHLQLLNQNVKHSWMIKRMENL